MSLLLRQRCSGLVIISAKKFSCKPRLSSLSEVHTELLEHTTCPNCWNDFQVEDVKWVSANEELTGDYRLGSEAPKRFKPSRFDVNGNAIDLRGMSCLELACPHCHLKIPRSVLVFKPLFVSIAGTQACGKSFFLASMTWQLRKTLANEFGLQMSDSDGECNAILNEYESQLFFSDEEFCRLKKTAEMGDWYNSVQYENQSVTYPKPFYFDIRPLEDHVNVSEGRRISRMLCLYDNAGESFASGKDTAAEPLTKHLGLAESWLFCFDPTQDPRFRKLLAGKSDDVQVKESLVTHRQDQALVEMVNRIRRHSHLGLKDKSTKPLIVVCTKFDAWSALFSELPKPWGKSAGSGKTILNLSNIEKVSNELKELLQTHCPEVVAAAQSISENVYFVPVSASGVSPSQVEVGYFIPVAQIDPQWCEVPFLITAAHRTPKLVFRGRAEKKTSAQSSGEYQV